VILAGVDTSASTMAWVTAQILSRPAIFAKVRQELHQVLGSGQTGQTSAEQFDQMPYLDAVIHETTRLCPLLFTTTPRLLIQPLQMGDFLLPQGTMVASCMNVIHTRPDYYPDPLSFRPERFIETKPDPYRYIFFGGGIRRCPGMAFALYEMKVIIATILHSCTFELLDVSTVAERQGSFFAPKGSISVKLAGPNPFHRRPCATESGIPSIPQRALP
jgi:cytochrome P450 family 110